MGKHEQGDRVRTGEVGEPAAGMRRTYTEVEAADLERARRQDPYGEVVVPRVPWSHPTERRTATSLKGRGLPDALERLVELFGVSPLGAMAEPAPASSR